MGKTIGILSLKGGVGKTSTVVSLGSAISAQGKRVLLVDGNLSAPNLGIHLNLMSPEVTMHHVLHGKANVEDAVYGMEDFGFDVIPSSVFYNGEVNPLKLRDKLKSLKKKYDFILLDSSPALNDETLAVMLAADERFIVTTPDYPTLSMTIKSIKDARSRGIRINGIILNKVYGKPFELSIGQIEDTAEVPVLALIPEDFRVPESTAKFTPSVMRNPKSKGTKEYLKLAGVVTGEKVKDQGVRRFMKLKPTPNHQDVNRELYYRRVFG